MRTAQVAKTDLSMSAESADIDEFVSVRSPAASSRTSMVDLPTYRFEQYIFRPAGPEDLALAQAWNAADAEHDWEMTFPLYWIEQNNCANSYLLEDPGGTLFFLKSIRKPNAEVEITLQFDRSQVMVSGWRAMAGMRVGFQWLKKALPLNGFRAVYFVSKNPQLISFAEKALGFKRDGDRLIYYLTPEGRQWLN